MNTNQTTGYPSIDKPWLKYYPKDADKIEPINLTYYEYYLKANKNYLNNPGIDYYKNVISRRNVINNSDIAAKILNCLGVKKREQVLFGMIGIPEAFYIIMGLSKIGAGVNIVNITYEKDLLIDSVINSDLSTQPSENHVFSRLFACVILKSYVFSLVFSLMSENKGNFLLFAADYLIQQPCGSTLRFPCSVSVDIHCGTDISVSEKLLHILWCCSI